MDAPAYPEGDVALLARQPDSPGEVLLPGNEPAVHGMFFEEGLLLFSTIFAAKKEFEISSIGRESMRRFLDLIRKLLWVNDTPERTALAFSVGVFLGYSPFLGLHTLAGIAIAFLFKLNRVAVLLGVWSNTPWWLVPYYVIATWVGTKVIGFQIDQAAIVEIFRLGRDHGFFASEFWKQLATQGGYLLSFGIGSLLFALALGLIAYPLSLKWIAFYRSRRPL